MPKSTDREQLAHAKRIILGLLDQLQAESSEDEPSALEVEARRFLIES